MSEDIEILSEIEAVRQSPWMYIGALGAEGAHHLLREVVHNAVDEAMLGHCNQISIALEDASCTIRDNGRGIPTEIHPHVGIPSCEVALTRLHAGSKFKKDPARFTTGLHGVGLSCVNALAHTLNVEIERGGKRFEQNFARGTALHALRELGPSATSGTQIRFSPDPKIFPEFENFQFNNCRDFIENLAVLNPGVQFELSSLEGSETFLHEKPSLAPLLNKVTQGQRVLLPEPISLKGVGEGLQFEALFNWTTEAKETVRSFVNCVETVHGGTHLNAFRAGLVKAVSKVVLEIAESTFRSAPPEVEEVSEGLSGVLSCKVAAPNFDAQTKTRFTSTDSIAAIETASAEQIYAQLKSNSGAAALIYDRIRNARSVRLAAKRVADRIYFQNARKEFNEEIYKEQFGARSKNWHDSAVWITDSKLLNQHAELCEDNSEAIALDVCCGSGVVGASLKGKVKKVIGLDLTPEMVKLASERLDEVVQGNVYNIPFADNTFDIVCTREVLHLLPFPERPVAEIYRVLKPGGQFLVGQILPFSEDDSAWMYRVFKKKQPLIFNMFQEEDFRRLLLSPGFTDMEMKELNVWESIDVWIDSYETTAIHRHEIREMFRNAPAEARAVHPFEISPDGKIRDLWRWCVFSVRKPK